MFSKIVFQQILGKTGINNTISLVGLDIEKLDFSLLSDSFHKVNKLYLGNNLIQHLPKLNWGPFTNTLQCLSLSNNLIVHLDDLQPLSQLSTLKKLSLVGNKVSRLPYYRETVICLCPSLQSLDGLSINEEDRIRAKVVNYRAKLTLSKIRLLVMQLLVLQHWTNLQTCHRELFRLLRVRRASDESHPSLVLEIAMTSGVFRWLQTSAGDSLDHNVWESVCSVRKENNNNNNKSWDDCMSHVLSERQAQLLQVLSLAGMPKERDGDVLIHCLDRLADSSFLHYNSLTIHPFSASGSYCGLGKHSHIDLPSEQQPQQPQQQCEKDQHREELQHRYQSLLASSGKRRKKNTNLEIMSHAVSLLPPQQLEPMDKHMTTTPILPISHEAFLVSWDESPLELEEEEQTWQRDCLDLQTDLLQLLKTKEGNSNNINVINNVNNVMTTHNNLSSSSSSNNMSMRELKDLVQSLTCDLQQMHRSEFLFRQQMTSSSSSSGEGGGVIQNYNDMWNRSLSLVTRAKQMKDSLTTKCLERDEEHRVCRQQWLIVNDDDDVNHGMLERFRSRLQQICKETELYEKELQDLNKLKHEQIIQMDRIDKSLSTVEEALQMSQTLLDDGQKERLYLLLTKRRRPHHTSRSRLLRLVWENWRREMKQRQQIFLFQSQKVVVYKELFWKRWRRYYWLKRTTNRPQQPSSLKSLSFLLQWKKWIQRMTSTMNANRQYLRMCLYRWSRGVIRLKNDRLRSRQTHLLLSLLQLCKLFNQWKLETKWNRNELIRRIEEMRQIRLMRLWNIWISRIDNKRQVMTMTMTTTILLIKKRIQRKMWYRWLRLMEMRKMLMERFGLKRFLSIWIRRRRRQRLQQKQEGRRRRDDSLDGWKKRKVWMQWKEWLLKKKKKKDIIIINRNTSSHMDDNNININNRNKNLTNSSHINNINRTIPRIFVSRDLLIISEYLHYKQSITPSPSLSIVQISKVTTVPIPLNDEKDDKKDDDDMYFYYWTRWRSFSKHRKNCLQNLSFRLEFVVKKCLLWTSFRVLVKIWIRKILNKCRNNHVFSTSTSTSIVKKEDEMITTTTITSRLRNQRMCISSFCDSLLLQRDECVARLTDGCNDLLVVETAALDCESSQRNIQTMVMIQSQRIDVLKREQKELLGNISCLKPSSSSSSSSSSCLSFPFPSSLNMTSEQGKLWKDMEDSYSQSQRESRVADSLRFVMSNRVSEEKYRLQELMMTKECLEQELCQGNQRRVDAQLQLVTVTNSLSDSFRLLSSHQKDCDEQIQSLSLQKHRLDHILMHLLEQETVLRDIVNRILLFQHKLRLIVVDNDDQDKENHLSTSYLGAIKASMQSNSNVKYPSISISRNNHIDSVSLKSMNEEDHDEGGVECEDICEEIRSITCRIRNRLHVATL